MHFNDILGLATYVLVPPLCDLTVRAFYRPPGWLRSYLIRWAAVAPAVTIVLVGIRLGWPRVVSELALSAMYLVLAPGMLNTLTLGRSSAWFSKLRHKRLCALVYVLAFTSIVAADLGWPPVVVWTCAPPAIAIAGTLIIMSRLRAQAQAS
ncbi:MAG TPA: hypothetical protein VG939_11870 [Caulobacteraceae bacterium]|nr:hypothetical protein [Caulobacteraceae bacterium]